MSFNSGTGSIYGRYHRSHNHSEKARQSRWLAAQKPVHADGCSIVPKVIPGFLGVSPPPNAFTTICSEGKQSHPEAFPLRTIGTDYFIKRWFSNNTSCHRRHLTFLIISWILPLRGFSRFQMHTRLNRVRPLPSIPSLQSSSPCLLQPYESS